jgi:transcriptional regulator
VELIRIGDKIINLQKVTKLVDKIMHMRSNGSTQADIANILGIERSFISHLEGLGEVRKGRRIALVGFPVSNIAEIEGLGEEFALDFVFLLSEKERRAFASKESGIELFNQLLDLVSRLKDYDVVIFLGSDYRISQVEKILDKEVLGISIGTSPIDKDVYVDTEQLRSIFDSLRIRDSQEKEGEYEKGRKRKSWILSKRSRRRK